MSHDTYPTATDLSVRLVATGIFSNPPTVLQQMLDMESAAGAAATEWERMTGYEPFLATATVAPAADPTYHFTPDLSCTLDLEGGFVSISAVSVNGIATTLNTEYRTMPQNAALKGKPITYLQFTPYYRLPFPALPGQVGSVAVSGVRGYSLTVPDDAWEAIMSIACGRMIPGVSHLFSGGLVKIKQADVEKTFAATGPYGSVAVGLAEQVRSAARSYRRYQAA